MFMSKLKIFQHIGILLVIVFIPFKEKFQILNTIGGFIGLGCLIIGLFIDRGIDGDEREKLMQLSHYAVDMSLINALMVWYSHSIFSILYIVAAILFLIVAILAFVELKIDKENEAK